MEELFNELYDLFEKESEMQLEQKMSSMSIDYLTLNHYQYLQAVNQLDAPTLSDISEYLDLSNASVSVMVKKLIKESLLEKIQSEEDKRSYHVQLTEFGKQIVDHDKNSFLSVMRRVEAELNKEERNQLRQILGKAIRKSVNRKE